MKVVYSCPLTFYTTGPGIPQGAIKDALDRASDNMMTCIQCGFSAKWDSKEMAYHHDAHPISPSWKRGEHEVYVITGDHFPYDHQSVYHGILFDSVACFEDVMKCDVFLGVGCASTFQIKSVHEHGGKAVTSWFSSHWKNAQKILTEEYPKFGRKGPALDELLIFRDIKEHEMCDALIAPSEYCAQTYRDNGCKNVHVVNFGVDSKKFHPADDSMVDLTFSVLFAGGNFIRKGLFYLLKAWSDCQFKDGMLTVQGSSVPGQYWNTKMLGWIPDERVPEIYQRNKIFCLPSLEEGSALVTYEAMASGMPLIVTKETGSIIEDGKEGIIVEPRNTKSIEDAIRYFHDNPSEIKRMGQNAREKALQYPWSRFGDGVVKVLEEVGKK